MDAGEKLAMDGNPDRSRMQQALNEHLKTESQQRDQLAMELTPALETMQRLAEAARRRVEEAAESQRLLEEAAGILKESEDRYFRLVELAPEMIAIHSDGKILFINPAGARLLGRRSGKVIGNRSWTDPPILRRRSRSGAAG